MRISSTTLMLVLVAFLALSAGCEDPAQPAQQHDELRRINKASSKPTPRVTDGSPIQFEKIGVWVVGPTNSTLGAQARWHLTDTPEKVQEYFRSKVTMVQPELGGGKATGLVLRCGYFDEGGGATGTDSLQVEIVEAGMVSVTFKNLGVGGRVSRIDVELEAVVWQSQGIETTVPVEHEQE